MCRAGEATIPALRLWTRQWTNPKVSEDDLAQYRTTICFPVYLCTKLYCLVIQTRVSEQIV